MSRTLKRKVLVVLAREFSLLEGGIKSGRFDLIFARPSDYPARAVRDHGYQFVASAKPDGQCFVVVPKDSPVKTLAEAKGQRWVMPEQVSYMAKLCTAELRERGMTLSKENQRPANDGAASASQSIATNRRLTYLHMSPCGEQPIPCDPPDSQGGAKKINSGCQGPQDER